MLTKSNVLGVSFCAIAGALMYLMGQHMEAKKYTKDREAFIIQAEGYEEGLRAYHAQVVGMKQEYTNMVGTINILFETIDKYKDIVREDHPDFLFPSYSLNTNQNWKDISGKYPNTLGITNQP